MSTKIPSEESRLNRSKTDAAESQSVCGQTSSVCYVKHYGYSSDQFAKQGDTVQFNEIRVISAGGRCRAKFDSYDELYQSDWSVYPASAALLKDGTVLLEGQR